MATTAIDYTARDFDVIKEQLKVHIQAKFPDTWRDFYESGMGQALMEICAYSFDILSFYCDYQANESYLPTAQDRVSILNLGKLVGYRMRTATSASVVCTATIAAVQAQDVLIPIGTTVTTPEDVTFSTISEHVITAGSTTADVTFVQGEIQSHTAIATGVGFQKIQLPIASVIYGSISVLVDGDEWTLSDSLVYGDPDSTIYAIEYDDDDFGYIQFGDGINGKLPAVGASVVITYRIGGGVQGNIAIGKVSQNITGTLQTAPPVDVAVGMINDNFRGSGGEARETISHAKLWIPRWVKTNNRAVTQEDFDTLANTFSDPVYGTFAFVKAKLRRNIPEYNTIDLYCFGRDSEGNIIAPSTALKDSIEAYFNNNGANAIRIICTDCEAQDGDILYVDVAVSVKIASDYAITDVTNNVEAAISNLFSSSVLIPGSDFRVGEIYKAVLDVTGVDYVVVTEISASSRYTEIIGVGDGTTTSYSGTLVLEPGLPVVPRSVTIQYGSPAVEVVSDDGNGLLVDSVAEPVGTIDYATGVYTLTFAAAPPSGTQVVFYYRYVLDYQRGQLELTADGNTARMRGNVSYPPIVPFTSGQKGIAFSDGNQVVIDDGSGNMSGDINPSGINTIDYTTGAYDFTFLNVPANGAEIWSTYRQLMQTSSQDLPIDSEQLAVESLITVTVL